MHFNSFNPSLSRFIRGSGIGKVWSKTILFSVLLDPFPIKGQTIQNSLPVAEPVAESVSVLQPVLLQAGFCRQPGKGREGADC